MPSNVGSAIQKRVRRKSPSLSIIFDPDVMAGALDLYLNLYLSPNAASSIT